MKNARKLSEALKGRKQQHKVKPYEKNTKQSSEALKGRNQQHKVKPYENIRSKNPEP